MTQPAIPAVVDGTRFASLAAMRIAHTALLRRYRDKGSSPELLDAARTFLAQGSAAGALIDGDDDRMAAQSLLDYWAAIMARADSPAEKAVLDDFDPALSPTLDDALCPYVGLESFSEETQKLFFGRRRVVEELITYLHGNLLLAVVGPSGSGKSSLVHGGLIPALKAGALPGSDAWCYYPPIVPGGDPMAHLVSAVTALAPKGTVVAPETSAIMATVDASKNQPGVFVVDQFEELFTVCENEQTYQVFAATLLALTQSTKHPNVVILTMRSDFDTQIASIPLLQASFERACRVPPLGAAELREAIERPAELVGLKLEDGLVDRLVKDILGEPAALPLLQFTLRQLWNQREGNRLTLNAYRQLGGSRQALARVADQFYDSLIPEDQITLKRILLRMVRPSAGLEVTSNRIRRESLYRAEPRERVDRVLDRALSSRLIRQTPGSGPGDEQLEVAHEALVRNWPRLVEWVEEDRVNLRRRLRLTAAAEQWRVHSKDPGGLLGGSLLSEALGYDDLNMLETEFVAASRTAAEQTAKHEEDIRRRELEQTRALAEEQQHRADIEASAGMALRKSNARLRRVAYIAVAMAMLAVLGWFNAERSRREALRKQQTVSASIKGQGVVVESETTHVAPAPASAPSGRSPSSSTPVAKPAGATAAPSVARPVGTAVAPSGGHLKQSSRPSSPLAAQTGGEESQRTSGSSTPAPAPPPPDLSLVQIHASAVQTGRIIPGTELPAYTFKVWIEGPPDVLDEIESVQYEFNHPTFRQKLMTTRDRTSRFQVGYTGWGCLSSVTVTFTMRDHDIQAPHRDFDMCTAINTVSLKAR